MSWFAYTYCYATAQVSVRRWQDRRFEKMWHAMWNGAPVS